MLDAIIVSTTTTEFVCTFVPEVWSAIFIPPTVTNPDAKVTAA